MGPYRGPIHLSCKLPGLFHVQYNTAVKNLYFDIAVLDPDTRPPDYRCVPTAGPFGMELGRFRFTGSESRLYSVCRFHVHARVAG